MATAKPKLARKVAMLETVKVRFRNSSSGMTGSSARISARMKSTRKTAPTMKPPMTPGADQSPFSARVRATRTGTMASVIVAMPTMSMLLRAPSRRIVGSSRAMTARAMMPIGRLTKKIQCQLTLSVRTPPRNGPTRKAMPKTAPNRPWYLPRSAGVNRSPITASEMGKSAPAPRPWMARKRISCHIAWLRPDRAEPTRKMPMPIISNGLRP